MLSNSMQKIHFHRANNLQKGSVLSVLKEGALLLVLYTKQQHTIWIYISIHFASVLYSLDIDLFTRVSSPRENLDIKSNGNDVLRKS